MNDKDIIIYRDRYNSRLLKYGNDPKALGWGGGKERQNVRFKNLIKNIKSNSSILDVGCGFGDLYGYLKLKKWKGEYFGVDINEKLLKVAKQTHKEIKVSRSDIQKENIKRYDWVISSGIFNAKLYHESNEIYIKEMLYKMFEISKRGIAVDFMTTYVDFQREGAFHTDPNYIIKLLKKKTWKIEVNMNYLKYEFCVIAEK